jgi:endonuclease/exonuclease/phosphatase family metal-dependent hydrolase
MRVKHTAHVKVHTACLLALLAAGALTPRGAASQVRAFRVMTWNIAAGHGDLSKTADLIRQVSPDVVALQEVDAHWETRSGFANQPEVLAKELGMHVRFGPIYSLPGEPGSPVREFGVAILSRYPIVDFRNHRLPRLSTQSAATEPELMPGFLEATVEIGGARVRLFTTHLDYRADPRVRKLQVTATIARLDALNGPTILMGDLNAPPRAVELAPLFQRLRDAWPDGPDTGFTYPATAPVRRIDYILTSGDLRAGNARVLPTEASDHRPVVVDLSHSP